MRIYEFENLSEDMRHMLNRHTKLDANKAVSYLPLSTIENVIRVSVDTYTSTIENNGGSYLIFNERECCISSGAVYAFLPEELDAILTSNKDVLSALNVPCDTVGFIRAIASTWFESGAGIMPLLKKVFGDT